MINDFSIESKLKSGDFSIDTHLHEVYEINFMLTDNVDVFIDDTFYRSKCGDVFIFSPFAFHNINSKGNPFKRYVMFFSDDGIAASAAALMPLLNELKKPHQPIIHLCKKDSSKLQKLFDATEQAWHSSGIYSDFECISSFGKILSFLLPRLDKSTDKDIHASSYYKIQKILTYVNENIADNLTVESVAAHFNISTTTLWHIMRSNLDMSLKDYIIKTRISKAMELLKENHSVIEASDLSGFNSYSHFIRTFTKTVGISPYKYAKKNL